jgi:hypothetical protein
MQIDITVPDITERDNANLAIAVQRIVTAFTPLYNAKLIEQKEFTRLVYRFVAETIPESGRQYADPDHIGDCAASPRDKSRRCIDFVPVKVRGGGSKLPNTDPFDPPKEDPNVP